MIPHCSGGLGRGRSGSPAVAGIAVAAALALGSCASGPTERQVLPLPAARLAELDRLIASDSYLEALQEIAWLRTASDSSVDPGSLDGLEQQATGRLADAFTKAIAEKSWADALRLQQSALALGRSDLAPGYTETGLLREIARAREAAGDEVVGLAERLRAEAAAGSTESELREDFAAATRLGSWGVARAISAEMQRRGFESPGSLAEAPQFASMLRGSVTIWVNRGIKIEKGVGYPDRVIGSGFFIDRRGYLLTNYHVISSEVDPKYEGFSRLYVQISGTPGDRIPAKVVGWDPVLDLALIKVEVDAPFVFSGDPVAQVAVGERIYAIGSPAGLDHTLTSGIVSAAAGRRFLQMGEALQVDVPLNPGSSGGPLLRENGDVIGIVFAGLEQFEGINFAVPWYWVERVLPSLYAGGEAVHAWLGAALAETDRGLEVLYTVPGEPAERAGLEPGDLLVSIGSRPVSTLRDAQDALLGPSPPSLVTIDVSRDGSPRRLLACVARRPSSPIEVALKRDALDGVLYPLFGMRLERTGSTFGRMTFTVRRVVPGSVADEAGLSENDPLMIQNWTVDTERRLAELEIVVQKKKAGFIESAVQIGAWLDTDNFI